MIPFLTEVVEFTTAMFVLSVAAASFFKNAHDETAPNLTKKTFGNNGKISGRELIGGLVPQRASDVFQSEIQCENKVGVL